MMTGSTRESASFSNDRRYQLLRLPSSYLRDTEARLIILSSPRHHVTTWTRRGLAMPDLYVLLRSRSLTLHGPHALRTTIISLMLTTNLSADVLTVVFRPLHALIKIWLVKSSDKSSARTWWDNFPLLETYPVELLQLKKRCLLRDRIMTMQQWLQMMESIITLRNSVILTARALTSKTSKVVKRNHQRKSIQRAIRATVEWFLIIL